MINITVLVMGLIMIITAIFAFKTEKMVTAIIASGIISLLASVIFLVLAAPDVAMTEASIGSGLTTIVFLYALNKIKKGAKDD